MTEREFAHGLRHGLGSAIIELKKNSNRIQYRDILLRYCLRDISHDPQVEGTKGYYLFTAAETFDDPSYFLGKIADRFGKRISLHLSEQLLVELWCFSDAGYMAAEEAIESKYSDLKKRLPKMREYRTEYCEREQLESIMIGKLEKGFKAFKKCVDDICEMLEICGNNDCLWCDYFFSCAKQRFGEKRVNDYINVMCERSDAFKMLIAGLNENEALQKARQKQREKEAVTVPLLIQYAREPVQNDNGIGKMPRYRPLFSKNATVTDFEELAKSVLKEKDETAKARLLTMFRRRAFPLDIAPLIEYTQSENELLSRIALEQLGYCKDERIHDFAIQLLQEKGLECGALALLKLNYQKTDDPIIKKLITKKTRILQYVQSDIAGIYKRHRSENALGILMHVYRKGECAHCRHNIVLAMRHCGVLSNEIIEECLYDSYEETRQLAKKLTAQSAHNPCAVAPN